MLTMVLGGLWHGAGWTFINWGIFHGIILIAYRMFSKKDKSKKVQKQGFTLSRIFKMIVFFHLICISWLLFRAESMSQVWLMFVQIFTNFTLTEFSIYGMFMIAFYAGPLFLWEIWIEQSEDLLKPLHIGWQYKTMAYFYIIIMILIFTPVINQEFIYFQF